VDRHRDKCTHASSKLRMCARIWFPCTLSASLVMGAPASARLSEPASSSVAFSDSSLSRYTLAVLRCCVGKGGGEPEYLAHALHPPNGHDLVLDLLAAGLLGFVLGSGACLVVVGRGREGFFELFLRADCEHCEEHVRDCEREGVIGWARESQLISLYDDAPERASRMGTDSTLGADKRQAPRERVHKVGQPVRMRARVELPDGDVAVGVLDYRAAIVVDVEVVGRGEDGNH
jgi:hypothetical protein